MLRGASAQDNGRSEMKTEKTQNETKADSALDKQKNTDFGTTHDLQELNCALKELTCARQLGSKMPLLRTRGGTGFGKCTAQSTKRSPTFGPRLTHSN